MKKFATHSALYVAGALYTQINCRQTKLYRISNPARKNFSILNYATHATANYFS